MPAARKLNVWLAFVVGGVCGAAIGATRGVIVYGGFDVGFLFNHVLGGFFLGAAALVVFTVVLNWFRRHPVR